MADAASVHDDDFEIEVVDSIHVGRDSMQSDEESLDGQSERPTPSVRSGQGGVAPPVAPVENSIPKDPTPAPSSSKLSKQGKKQCRGCAKWLLLADFPQNSAFCWEDKRALDNIVKLCKTEEDREFVKAERQNSKSAQRMLKSYFSAAEGGGVGKRARSHDWQFGQYKESIIAESVTEHIDRGRMMNKEEYMMHAATVEKISSAKADENWTKWKNEGIVLSEGEGTNMKLRIKLGDDVNYANRFGSRKEGSLYGRQIKKPDAIELSKMTKKVVTDHDLLQQQSGFDLQKVAALMAATGSCSGSASSGEAAAPSGVFSGKGLMIPDVKDLFIKKEEETIKEEPEAQDSATGGDDAGGIAPKNEKRGRFWARDRSLATATQTANLQAAELGKIYKNSDHDDKFHNDKEQL